MILDSNNRKIMYLDQDSNLKVHSLKEVLDTQSHSTTSPLHAIVKRLKYMKAAVNTITQPAVVGATATPKTNIKPTLNDKAVYNSTTDLKQPHHLKLRKTNTINSRMNT